ncbi:importin-5-like [Anneissia japonica]|uniref:importin-5-like n=1 Tax=Anneissia japonica TaxID=1529436 RepID=UPI0014257239|nr:importin-5-like [Anneissia japonica]
MADQQPQFNQLLGTLMSSDNDIRTTSEKTYDAIPANKKIPYLVTSLQTQALAPELRQFAAVLLRRFLSVNFENDWQTLTPEQQVAIKAQLLASVQRDSQPLVRRRICDTVAELSRSLIDEDGNNTWPEILQFLFDNASSQDPGNRECALNVFNNFPGIFGNKQNHYIEVIKQMLEQSLMDSSSSEVQIMAARATISFLLYQGKDIATQKHFLHLTPGLLKAVELCVSQQDDDALLKAFIELVETAPKMVRSHLQEVLTMFIYITSNKALTDSWRQLGLEVIVTLSETAPAMMRKHQNFIPTIVPEMLAMMVDIEDDADWANSDEVDDDDFDTNAVTGESALDRFACGIGGKFILPHIIATVPKMLQNDNWKYRHAGLMAISAVGEGCHTQMEAVLNTIVDSVLPFLGDPHPRVRYAACNALGQMATDFAPTFERKFHEKVVPGLVAVLDDFANARVQAHAGAALVNFCEDCPKEYIVPYLALILGKLHSILVVKIQELVQKGTKLVLEQMVTTLAAVADSAEDKFIQYYDNFMPGLKNIVQHATSKELRLLRGKTIECISLIGLAVGQQKFMQDASDIMELLLKTQTDANELEDDDPQISYMISAWARMCKLLGKDFQQYLPVVMGPLLKTASLKPEVALLDTEDAQNLREDEGWQFVNLGDQQSFGIRTSGLDDKSTACQMLVCYAKELKEAFADYTEQVVKIMVPLLKFYFHDVVRYTAAESLPVLLECAKIKGEEYLAQMWQFIYPNIMQAIQTEPEVDILQQHMDSFAKCIEFLGKGCMSEQQMNELMKAINDLFEHHFKRQQERQEQRKDEDYDDIVEEGLQDEDDDDVYVLSKISDILHSFIGTHGDLSLPYFEAVLPNLVKLLEPGRPWTDRQWAICIFDDVIEYCGPCSWKYQQYFLRQMIDLLQDKSPEVRQACAYGCGIMGKCGGPQYANACYEAIPCLSQMITAENSRAPENVSATENAIAAVAKILQANHSNINSLEVLPNWLTWLPLTEDKEEAAHVYNFLCSLVESNNPVVLGANNTNLPRILLILSETFAKEALSDDKETFQRCVNIIKQIQSNQELWNACIAQLSPEQQLPLAEALQKAE